MMAEIKKRGEGKLYFQKDKEVGLWIGEWRIVWAG
jgi:hypothetical protein